MSESDGEQAARSLALEQAYVHEVYEQCADRTIHAGHWPRIYHFLEELEPGALVCDIGCGNGKYLNVNHNVFKIGVDRCTRFTNIAREKENEVLACDNLALPFRDESFDAVLSVAVVHHFSTTERRVRAIKELARVLRIGGRLVISVWAMEQKHRKFESQDVLVPWPKAYCISSSGSPMKPRGMSYDERLHRGKNAQTYLLSKRGSQRNGSKNKSYWVDPIFSPSPSTSSLSSPNETCYSFFRRALQKLAGGRRGSRAWFVENWQNGRREHGDEDEDDVDDLPIELRRLEDSSSMPLTTKEAAAAVVASSSGKPPLRQQLSDSLSVKSKSLSNIVEVQRIDLVRSRSSLPGLPGLGADEQQQQQEHEALQQQQQQQTAAAASHQPPSKPRLVKQKTHYGDDACLDNVPENTAIKPILQDVPEIHVASRPSGGGRRNVHKQSSMNEELMSIERLRERESVRKNIMKQASLNEELIYKSRPTFEAFRDTLYSGGARFQLLKSDLTNRIKQSTTGMEKVSGMSIKNGFVRILQSWNKSTESPLNGDQTKQQQQQQPPVVVHRDGSTGGSEVGIERRMSREDGSDSSKDSSLQSDTSVDSEDSFASVIYVPKKSSSPLVEGVGSLVAGAAGGGLQLSTTSAPPSPRVKYAPELGPARLKLISVSPLLKQFPATSKSLPPPSPPGLSPRTLNSANMRPFFSGVEANAAAAAAPASLGERIAQVKRSFDVQQPLPPMPPMLVEASAVVQPTEPPAPAPPAKPITAETTRTARHPHRQLSEVHTSRGGGGGGARRSSVQLMRGYRSMSATLEAEEEGARRAEEDGPPTDAIDEALEQLSGRSEVAARSGEDDSRSSRLNQIKQLLRAKPGFAARTKPSFPLVRRASSAASCARLEPLGKALPRLLSLELFNPETDDLDSDSSGVSSPESVGSVISVISDERYLSKKKSDSSGETTDSSKELGSCSTKPDELSTDQADLLSQKSSTTDDSDSLIDGSTSSSHSLRLASVDDSVEPTSTRPNSLDKHISPVESTWNEECNRHLIDLTDRLSGTLINDIDQFCRRTKLEFDEAPTNLIPTRHPRQESAPAQKVSRAQQRPDSECSCGEPDGGAREESIQRSLSEDSDAGSSSGAGSFVLAAQPQQQQRQQRPKLQQRSIESSDIGDSIENTISESESSLGARRFCTGSTASLASLEPRAARLCAQTRSASEELPRAAAARPPRTAPTSSNATLSGSSSQESLPSDQITYHQYYHVFREGELDQLIDKYVENLHIISSYYDHASWCIVAEKVQVWTI